MTEQPERPWQCRVEDAAVEFARTCTALYMDNPYAEPLLERAMNTLMTELWDRGFSQLEIRAAFEAAAAEMPRYAAGEERNGGEATFSGSSF